LSSGYITDPLSFFFEQLGQRIANLRKTQNMTQGQLAEHLGISQQHMASFEKGSRKVPASMLPVLAQLFGISVDELVGLKDTAAKRGPMPKLQRQIEQVALLPKAKQKFVTSSGQGMGLNPRKLITRGR
jgi:transcriptional regulator with XRE-family HTH domain